MNIQYSVLDVDPDAETRFSMDTLWNPAHKNLDYIAVECAEDYIEWHDGFEGWNDDQSLAFALFLEDGTPMGVYDVTMEMKPTFGASLRKPARKTADSR